MKQMTVADAEYAGKRKQTRKESIPDRDGTGGAVEGPDRTALRISASPFSLTITHDRRSVSRKAKRHRIPVLIVDI